MFQTRTRAACTRNVTRVHRPRTGVPGTRYEIHVRGIHRDFTNITWKCIVVQQYDGGDGGGSNDHRRGEHSAYATRTAASQYVKLNLCCLAAAAMLLDVMF